MWKKCAVCIGCILGGLDGSTSAHYANGVNSRAIASTASKNIAQASSSKSSQPIKWSMGRMLCHSLTIFCLSSGVFCAFFAGPLGFVMGVALLVGGVVSGAITSFGFKQEKNGKTSQSSYIEWPVGKVACYSLSIGGLGGGIVCALLSGAIGFAFGAFLLTGSLITAAIAVFGFKQPLPVMLMFQASSVGGNQKKQSKQPVAISSPGLSATPQIPVGSTVTQSPYMLSSTNVSTLSAEESDPEKAQRLPVMSGGRSMSKSVDDGCGMSTKKGRKDTSLSDPVLLSMLSKMMEFGTGSIMFGDMTQQGTVLTSSDESVSSEAKCHVAAQIAVKSGDYIIVNHMNNRSFNKFVDDSLSDGSVILDEDIINKLHSALDALCVTLARSDGDADSVQIRVDAEKQLAQLCLYIAKQYVDVFERVILPKAKENAFLKDVLCRALSGNGENILYCLIVQSSYKNDKISEFLNLFDDNVSRNMLCPPDCEGLMVASPFLGALRLRDVECVKFLLDLVCGDDDIWLRVLSYRSALQGSCIEQMFVLGGNCCEKLKIFFEKVPDDLLLSVLENDGQKKKVLRRERRLLSVDVPAHVMNLCLCNMINEVVFSEVFEEILRVARNKQLSGDARLHKMIRDVLFAAVFADKVQCVDGIVKAIYNVFIEDEETKKVVMEYIFTDSGLPEFLSSGRYTGCSCPLDFAKQINKGVGNYVIFGALDSVVGILNSDCSVPMIDVLSLYCHVK